MIIFHEVVDLITFIKQTDKIKKKTRRFVKKAMKAKLMRQLNKVYFRNKYGKVNMNQNKNNVK